MPKWIESALIVCMLLTTRSAAAQIPVFEMEATTAPPEAGAIPLGTPVAPGMPPESWYLQNGAITVRNVSQATLTPVLPAGPSSGAAVIVAPGGGFLSLSMDTEGWAVARWLANHGIAAFVLKYRLVPTPASLDVFEPEFNRLVHGETVSFVRPTETPRTAIEDALAALRLVRTRAAEFAVDPKRVGLIGFSAGAITTVSTVQAADPASMPAFIGVIYGPMTAIEPPADAPPLLAVLAQDDPLFGQRPFGLTESWRKAGRPVELLYLTSGSHGFGLGTPGTASVGWIRTFETWLAAIGMLPQRRDSLHGGR